MRALEDVCELLLERLAGAGVEDMRPSGDKEGMHRGSCPHCGKSDRFMIGPYDDGRGYWIKCHAHCERRDILTVLELGWSDLQVDDRESEQRIAAVRAPELATVRPVRWLWKRRIPIAKTSLVAGAEGVGKGMTIAWISAQLSRGRLAGDLYGTPATTLIIGDEDAMDDWTARLHVAGADFKHVRFQVIGDIDIDFTAPVHVEHLRGLIQLCLARFVVFDALLDHVGGVGIDEFKPKAVRHALRPLRRLAIEEDVAVLGAMHPRKGRVLTFRDLVANSHQFNAISRSSLLLARHPENEELRVLAWGKGNYAGQVPTLEFRVEPVVFRSPRGELIETVRAVDWRETDVTLEAAVNASAGARDAGPSKQDQAEDAICDALAGGPRLSSEVKAEVIQKLGCKHATVERAVTELRFAGVLASTGNTSAMQWELSSELSSRSYAKAEEESREEAPAEAKTPVDTAFSAPDGALHQLSSSERAYSGEESCEQAPLPLDEAASDNGAGTRQRAAESLRRFQEDSA